MSKLYLELSQVVPASTMTGREIALRKAMEKSLGHLDHATPKTRNGPTYQAADALRSALGLSPMVIGGQPSDGVV